MSKRQFLMLSHTYEDDKNINIAGWLYSQKMDGLRVFWDGGISRGVPVGDVPYANIERDARFINPNYIATGLWSRNAKVIRAPNWFLDALPKIPLDGEFWSGVGKWEETSSIIKDIVPNNADWRKVQFQVFESPPLETIFDNGDIGNAGDIYHKSFSNILDWVKDQVKPKNIIIDPTHREFEFLYSWLQKQNIENEYVKLLPQIQLPWSLPEARLIIDQALTEVVAAGGEGLMLRKATSYYETERSKNLLKVKRWLDSEAIVTGYVWGRRTKKESKLLGKMGALIVDWNGIKFELSGFTYAEREMRFVTGGSAAEIGYHHAGKQVFDPTIFNPTFPIGSRVTFRYRELSANGIPKMAVYLRKSA